MQDVKPSNTSSFNSEANDFCVEVEDDEANLLNCNASKVKDQNSRLLEVYKKTQSNLQAGANVLLDLRKQREQLNRAGLALEDTDGDLAYSNRVMNKIFRRIAVNRALYWGILSLLMMIKKLETQSGSFAMPPRKSAISETNIAIKRKKLNESLPNHSEQAHGVSTLIYEHLYSKGSDKLPFAINSKKKEEAEKIFENCIKSKAITECIVLKGPTGCGKSFLGDVLIEKFGHLIRLGDLDYLPTLPFSSINSNRDEYSQFLNTNNLNNFKCSNSLFPALQFSTCTVGSDDSRILNEKKVISRITDADFLLYGSDKDYLQIRKYVDMLKSHAGILLIELTEFEFEGSMHNYILKVLNETFSNNVQVLSINSCSPTVFKKTLEPLKSLRVTIEDVLSQFNGDSRSTLHDLFIYSLKPLSDSSFVDSVRDYRTDFFHYVGKLLYPAKSKNYKIFDNITFWDLDFDLYMTFLQFYFPKFVSDLQIISEFMDYSCLFDNISWKVLKHVSIEHHLNACKYSPILACFLFINDPKVSKSTQKFFSFARPPIINTQTSSSIRRESRKLGMNPEDMIIISNLKNQKK